MGLLASKNLGTEAERAIAKEVTKPWYLKVESLLVITNIFVLVINIFFTYWYSSKPSQIRAQCLAEGELNPTAISISDDIARFKYIDTYYQNCIHRFGLDK